MDWLSRRISFFLFLVIEIVIEIGVAMKWHGFDLFTWMFSFNKYLARLSNGHFSGDFNFAFTVKPIPSSIRYSHRLLRKDVNRRKTKVCSAVAYEQSSNGFAFDFALHFRYLFKWYYSKKRWWDKNMFIAFIYRILRQKERTTHGKLSLLNFALRILLHFFSLFSCQIN